MSAAYDDGINAPCRHCGSPCGLWCTFCIGARRALDRANTIAAVARPMTVNDLDKGSRERLEDAWVKISASAHGGHSKVTGRDLDRKCTCGGRVFQIKSDGPNQAWLKCLRCGERQI